MRSIHRIAAGLVLALSLAGGLAAQDVQLPLSAIQVKHFALAEGVDKTQDFVNYFYDGLLGYLPKTKVAAQVVPEEGAVAEADAGNAVLVEGKLLFVGRKGMIGLVRSEISLYRVSDHKLVTTFTAEVPYKRSPLNKDKNVGENTGQRTAIAIQKELKKLKAA